jgi:hypothetical protein
MASDLRRGGWLPAGFTGGLLAKKASEKRSVRSSDSKIYFWLFCRGTALWFAEILGKSSSSVFYRRSGRPILPKFSAPSGTVVGKHSSTFIRF